MRATSPKRRAENTNNARRYNGGKGAERGPSAFQARKDAPCPEGKVKCPTCYRPVRLRSDGRLFSHNGCPQGGEYAPIYQPEEVSSCPSWTP